MQAILVKYLPATNYRPSRYKAIAAAGTLTQSVDFELPDGPAARRVVAVALAVKLGWTDPAYGPLVGGQLPSGDYAFVFVPPDAYAAADTARTDFPRPLSVSLPVRNS